MRPFVHRTLSVAAAAVLAAALLPGAPAAADSDGGPVIGPPRGDQMHVMSYNIRYDNPDDANTWTERRPALKRLLAEERPTVLGIQEGLYNQVRDIEADLPDRYDWIGLGRQGGSKDEFAAIYYDTGRVAPVAYDHFWLSDTPDVIGSTSWGNEITRMVTWVRFEDRRTGAEFVHVNTHFDHQSENSRRKSAELVRERIGAMGEDVPVVLTGDFNAPAGDSAPFDILTGDGALSDTWDTAAERATPAYGTFNNYEEPVEGGERIDWLLANSGVEVRQAAINPFTHGGLHPSDHLPVHALVELE
ncbi:endonuclease/exonuclease/phosphatase family metal-dependent hydrolase [Murinocardiopsis flavida]|uniref:Endonuclease/exonuclease/phosphatase family metal-dependent hydrolase n=1 Tax=Murinocardiopsis flavida TaxID=645275 RepID=A0A2P8DQZ6_9ACTN|nr:endonuclease/exonuclease/phosphatase family protein [Murinocardiopsis flavida]PSK99639.1 endonuclease/exonuclease/phosphatase family metal-dependent hydrolase [Murinocardiopsis flavida]